MIDLHPAIRTSTISVPQYNSIQSGIKLPNRCSSVLGIRSPFQWKGIEVLAVASQLNTDNRFQVLAHSEAVDMRLPVADAIMLRSGCKLDVLGDMVDNPVVGVAIVVTAGS